MSLDQTKNQPSTSSPDAVLEQVQVPSPPRDSTTTAITPVRTNNIEEKREWIQRRERLHHLIGLDRPETTTIVKTATVESMLKTQRENFGITMPVLGQFVRKYMQHRPRTNFDSLKIHAGKVHSTQYFFHSTIVLSGFFSRQLFIRYYHYQKRFH